uniref:Uncharacterized protein n=1 Tax=Anguilla anguilla TaxID=7936 RepID=A0A0E9W8U7_ANGAN
MMRADLTANSKSGSVCVQWQRRRDSRINSVKTSRDLPHQGGQSCSELFTSLLVNLEKYPSV